MDLTPKTIAALPRVVLGAVLAFTFASAGNSAGFAFEVDWKETYYNPQASADDLVLPMPCGGAMVFRPVVTPHGSRNLDDREIELGDQSNGYNYLQGRRYTHVSGPFRLGHSRGFYLGKYEVAMAQYHAVMASDCPDDPPRRRDFVAQSELTWLEAVDFTQRYSQWLMQEARDHLPTVDGIPAFVRLPTEAEWEYAARGGAAVDVAEFRAPQIQTDGKGVAAFAAIGDANSANGRIQPIGTLQPNPLGLHDVYGNVAEVVLDPFQLTRLGRLHGSLGGFIKKGGDARTAATQIASGMRQEQPFFDTQSGEAFRDVYLGMRVILATISIRTEETAAELRSEVASISESNLSGFVALKEGEALSALERAASNPRYLELAPELRGIRLSLEEARAARNTQSERAVQAMLMAGAAMCSRIDAQYGSARVVEEILAQIKEAEAGVADEADRATIRTKVRSVEDRRRSIKDGIKTNLSLYAWLVDTIATDYRIDVIEAQAEAVRGEYEQRRQLDQIACAPRLLAHIRLRQERGTIELEDWGR